MKLVIKTEDVTPGHLVEAGFDKFSAQLIQITSSTTSPETDLFTFHPNPVSSELFIEVKIIHLWSFWTSWVKLLLSRQTMQNQSMCHI